MRKLGTMKFWLSNEEDTRAAGAALASDLLPLTVEGSVVVFVRGNLGAGKSTFVRGFLTAVGVTGVMPSPTYSLVEPYKTDSLQVFHMDAYRIADGAELDYLGLDDIDKSGSILLVEWPDHVRDALPDPTVTVDLKMSPPPDRQGPEQDQAVDRHNQAADRHSGGRLDSLSGANQDRHVKTAIDSQVESLDSHKSAKASVLGAEHGAPDSEVSSVGMFGNPMYEENDEGATTRVSRTGRLISLTIDKVPVQGEVMIGLSSAWSPIFRVVT